MTDKKRFLRRTLATAAILAALLAILLPAQAAGAEHFIIVASTTSTQNSGLFGHILPLFTKKTGIRVRIVAVGTGQAIRLARNGDADVLFVHHRASEEKFVRDGYGVRRFDVMYNDFIIVGPKKDPARVKGEADVAKALSAIARGAEVAGAVFTSRGDDSGTHKKELSLWKAAGVDVAAKSGSWYRETGSGMGATLNTASAMSAYALTDRATWLNFKNRGGLGVLVEGDKRLYNQYGVILVSPERHPHVKAKLGRAFIGWLTSPEGQAAIGEYKIKGNPAFFPNAKR